MSQIYAKVQYIAKKHEFKIGFDKENNLSSTKQGPTGGAYITLVRPNTSDPLTKDRNAYSYWYRLYPENPWSKERGGYFAFFAQDKWTLREGLLINLGMRFERNSMKPEGGQYFDLDSWSPRVSVSWDPWKNGRSKFYLSWGRYVERIPTGFINSMEPGRGYVYEYYRGDNPWFTDYSGSIPATVLPGTGNQYAEELAGGFDIEVTPDFAISVVAQYRELKQVIEDIGYMTSDGLINYFIATLTAPTPISADRSPTGQARSSGRRFRGRSRSEGTRLSRSRPTSASPITGSQRQLCPLLPQGQTLKAAAGVFPRPGATATLRSITTFRTAFSSRTPTASFPRTEGMS